MTTVYLSPVGNVQFFDDNGVPLDTGKIYTYAAGTTTNQATYTTSAGNVQNANPIELGSDGRPPNEIWLTTGVAYKLVLTDANGNQLDAWDNVTGVNDVTSANVTFIRAGAGAVSRTVQAKLRDEAGAIDIGIVPNDNTARAANTAALLQFWTDGYSALKFRADGETYYFESITLPNKVISLRADGVMRPDNPCILDFSPTGTVAISAPVGSELGRHSRIQGFTIVTGLTKTAIKIDQGGLTLQDLHVNDSNIGLHITQSYGATYDRLTLQGQTKGVYLDGTTVSTVPGAMYNNYFGAIAVNNKPTSNPIISAGSKGVHVYSGAAGVIAGNKWALLDASRCDTGWYAENGGGSILQNKIEVMYCEANVTRNRDYTNATAATDSFGELYQGSPTAPNPDVLADGVGLDDNGTLSRSFVRALPTTDALATAVASTRSVVGQATAGYWTELEYNKVSGHRFYWRGVKSLPSAGAPIDLFTTSTTGTDAGSSITITVEIFEIGNGGIYCNSLGIARCYGINFSTNNIPVAATATHSDTLVPGTLAWGSASGSSTLRYTPDAAADNTVIVATVVSRKLDSITPA